MALLPIKDNEVLEAYSGTHWAAPGPIDGSVTPYNVDVGAISFSYYDKWNEPSEMAAKLGQIRWNPDEVFGVAIDGQHRLAAIKSLVSSNVGDRAAKTEVPVILLVFDGRLDTEGHLVAAT